MSAFTHRTAVITGASSGVGKAISLALASEGAAVRLVGRNLERLEEVAESARAKASSVATYVADLCIDQHTRELGASLQRDCDSIDLLIHSAGAIALGPVETAPVEDLDWQYRINVRAPYVLTQALLPMLRRSRGQIVLINSLVGHRAKAYCSQYSVTKHALKALGDSLRDEVNPDGLRVLSVFLGRTATPMQATVHQMECKAYHPELLVQPEDVAAIVLNAVALSRTSEVTEITIRHAIKQG
jgi:short-subunit dehydrogenase